MAEIAYTSDTSGSNAPALMILSAAMLKLLAG
jgi:hypothetical protein